MAHELCSKCKKLRYRTETCLGSAPCPLKLRAPASVVSAKKSEGRKNVAAPAAPAASSDKGLERGDSAPSAGRTSDKVSPRGEVAEPKAPPLPKARPQKNTPRGRSGTARKAPGEQSTAQADIEALKQGAKPAARTRGTKRLDDLGSVQDGLKMSSDGPAGGQGQDGLAHLPPAAVKRTAAQVKADMEAAIETIKKRGRPVKHPDRKAYRAEWMRKKRLEKASGK